MRYTYTPKGVCSQQIILDVENEIVNEIEVIGGCDGNLKGIASLVKGMKVEDVINKLKGIKCGYKETSCPDQISKALEALESLQQQ